ncbi:MAG: cyclic nucleotide-binding domain-containing protein [Candidatus Rifleibacteriota bacterium]
MIPVVTSDNSLYQSLSSILKHCENEPDTFHLSDSRSAMEYLSIEMPELVVIDFSDENLEIDSLAEEIRQDPWLLNSGIIGLTCHPRELRKSDRLLGLNVLALIHHGMIEQQLPGVIRIICHNRRILSQRFIGADLGSNISISFQLENDPLEAYCFTNLICNFLYNLNKIDANGKDQLNVVLVELLINAIEHGNCGISYEEKSQWLESGGDIFQLIQKKCSKPEIARRKVLLDYTIKPTHTSFRIEDEGEGFEWQELRHKADPRNLLDLHGRGIIISSGITENLTFNEKGNCVTFDFQHQEGIANVTPALFKNLQTVSINKGDIIFHEGEFCNYLYYIVRGSFEVLVEGTPVSVLTPDDIFIGEMSFLLNNKRSATVRATSEASLIKISKKDFVEGIREKPHYSLFLSKLLAKRIERLNHMISHNHNLETCNSKK